MQCGGYVVILVCSEAGGSAMMSTFWLRVVLSLEHPTLLAKPSSPCSTFPVCSTASVWASRKKTQSSRDVTQSSNVDNSFLISGISGCRCA
ncbi:hypothetical protein EDD16DRAFT_577185 [Pisolithus croceorrhizus]|nr:hypothetical protein F5141DRAFT_461116 [Pisolithus sp. B1]KAI6124205.1 hypothetical protein EDD16DRAFT_577185 [Pisolithus croceorrhizus]